MPIVHASIAPHSPMLLPAVRPDLAASFVATIQALQQMEGELYMMQPDVVFVISPHAPSSAEAFSVNYAPNFSANFREFGDTQTTVRGVADSQMVSQIRELADATHHDAPNVAVNVLHEPVLDYGAAVSLHYLLGHSANTAIVPLSISGLGLQQHFEFGQLLRAVASNSNKRVAILVSAELSHTVTAQSQYGYHPDGQTFDAKIQQMIQQNTLSDILSLNTQLIDSAQAWNASRSLAILFGALSDISCDAEILSYEAPTGVGLLVAHFNVV